MSQIFISYENRDGYAAGKLARALREAGYTTWLYDENSLPVVPYPKQIVEAIDKTDAFVLIISPRSINSNQINIELVKAHEKRKHIVPVLLDLTHAEFKERQPEWDLVLGAATSVSIPPAGVGPIIPGIIEGLKRLGVRPAYPAPPPLPIDTAESLGAPSGGADPEAIDKISPVYGRKVKKFLAGFLGLILLLAAGLLASRYWPTSAPWFTPLQTAQGRKELGGLQGRAFEKTPAGTSASLSEVTIEGGRLIFRTERLGPDKKEKNGKIQIASSIFGEDEISLAFQLNNQSNQIVTIAALKVILLGIVTTFEDQPSYKSSSACRNYLKQELSGIKRRTDLGILEFSLAGVKKTGVIESGNLLTNESVEMLEPQQMRSFLIKLRCVKTQQGDSFLISNSIGLFLDKKCRLFHLDVEPPTPDGAAHVFLIVADLLTERGERRRLYSDEIFTLYPRVSERLEFVRLDKIRPQNIPLLKWSGLPPDLFTKELVAWGVKSFQETRAYRVAKEGGHLPKGFDATEVSEYCYYQDQESPFRNLTPKDSKFKKDVMRVGGVRQARTNLVSFFQEILVKHPEIGALLLRNLGELEKAEDPPLRKKARYLKEKLKGQEYLHDVN
jgi:hypothetical protein